LHGQKFTNVIIEQSSNKIGDILVEKPLLTTL